MLLQTGSVKITGQETTLDNYTGSWQDAGSWSVGPPTMPYNVNGGIVTIHGYITSSATLNFSKGTLFISDGDTLVINGDLDIGNNADLSIGDGAILIVYGNMTVANQVDIAAGGFLVVTGDLTFSGSTAQGSFTSTEDPAQVYVGGTVTPPGGPNTGNFPVLDCGTGDHTSTDCNYGDLIDAGGSGINDFVQNNCTDDPNITSLSSNSPVVTGGTITLSANGDPGTGNWPLTYSWSGPNSYAATGNNPSIASATTAMTGYYVLTIFNDEGCSTSDSVFVDVSSSSCCAGYNYISRDNYTGNWNDVTTWATPDEAWRPLPPPTSPANSQPLCINGYVALNGDLTLDGGSMNICDTLVITGSLTLWNPTLTIQSTGVLVVLGDLIGDVNGSNGSVTNDGRIVFVGEFDKNSGKVIGGSGDVYVFDDTPNAPGYTPTGDETTLASNDPDLNDFINGLTCGSVSGGTISASQSICSGADVSAFTSTAGASPGTFTYQWYLSTNSSDPATGTWSAISGATAVTYDHGTLSQTTYFYRRGNKGAGCSANSNVLTVTVNALPTVNLGTDQEICEGDTVTLNAGAGFVSYTWSTGGTAQTEDITNSSDLTVDEVVTANVTVTDGNTCSGTSNTVTITIHPIPVTGPLNNIDPAYGN